MKIKFHILVINDLKRLKRLWQLMKGYRASFANLAFCDIMAPIISMTYPFLFAILIDEVFYNKSYSFFRIVLIAYLIIYLSSTLLYFIQRCTVSHLLTSFSGKMKKDMLEIIFYSQGEYLSSINTGDHVQLLNYDIDEIINYIHFNLFYPISSLIRLIFTITIVLSLNFKIALLMMFSVISSVLISKLLSQKIKVEQVDFRDKNGKYLGFLFEMLSNITGIKILSSSNKVSIKIGTFLSQLTESKTKVETVELMAERLNSLVTVISNILLYITATLMIFNNSLTLGMFVIIIDYYANANKFLLNLSNVYISSQKNFVSIDRVLKLIDNKIENQNTSSVKFHDGKIEFDDVSFKYPNKDEYVFEKLNFNVTPKTCVAIVGKNGIGKSTIINLLLGLYNLNEGVIRIDGNDMKEFSLEYLRKMIGVVHQDIVIFSGTIKYNLTFGDETISDEEIWRVCEQTCIAEIIRELPNQLDTKILDCSEFFSLSGGQMQRIAIARVLLKKPKILILDEATSAMDYVTERTIIEAIMSSCKDITVIVIAHRVTALKNCHEIVVIDNKHVTDIGVHDELMQRCDLYKKLFKEQTCL